MAIIKRLVKGSALSHTELDGNFTDLDGRVTTLENTADSDGQTLTLAGDNLTISGGNTVDLSTINSTGILNVVEDTTPQLGGNLELNGNQITGGGGSSISELLNVLTLVGGSNGIIMRAIGSGNIVIGDQAGDVVLGNSSSSVEFVNGVEVDLSDTNVNFTNATVTGLSVVQSIDDLTDVDTSTTPPGVGQVLKWDGAQWEPANDSSGSGGITLTALSVTQASAGTAGLVYNNVTGVFTYTPPDLSSYLTSVPAQTFASLTGTPTTIAGYGITDALALGTTSTTALAGDTALFDSTTTNVALGANAGATNQGADAVAIGNSAGNANQTTKAVAIGDWSGKTAQGSSAVALGHLAGTTNQGQYATALGHYAGANDQSSNAIAVGYNAAYENQGLQAIAIGASSANNQGANAIAIGSSAANNTQSEKAIAIGFQAGNGSQGVDAIAIGDQAGETTQGAQAIAIGKQAGETTQGEDAVAVGNAAGFLNQGQEATAIGPGAGITNQGANALALGVNAGRTSQATNSIAINATAGILENTTPDSLVIKPIRSAAGTTIMMYDATSGEVTHTASLDTNTIQTSSGNLAISADNYVQINSDNNGQIEIGTASGVGNVRIGNESNDTQVSIEGEVFINERAMFYKGVEEKFATLTGSTGVTTMDCANGHVHYLTGASGDITANFTNLGLTAEFATNLTVIIDQGNTAYEITAVQIGGAAQTIVWQGNSAPTGTANGVDSFSFTILNDGGTYVVLGQMVAFGGV